jgi:tRNA A-37 threonylcarbamoyl transferase component Bud32
VLIGVRPALNRNYLGVPGQSKLVRARILDIVANVTCGGEHVGSLYNCIHEGTLCSDHGQCRNMELSGSGASCLCDSGYEGDHCQTLTANSGSDVPLAPILGSIIPVGVVAFVVLLVAMVIMFVWARRTREREGDWEVDMSELEMGEQLGSGGYGEVHKAVWKGTEVAVKMMLSSSENGGGRELERNFKEEVRVMTALRHPNVVLFMAACTKPPKMCIVMEYMTLGSLFDVRHLLTTVHSPAHIRELTLTLARMHGQLLHNELIPDIPFALRNKMAYQAAKGMHFLHSSGIVHRDLKSLNLLLDAKWNVKVSDFGLTKFKEEMNRVNTKNVVQGSVHWTAPEVLNELMEVDFMLADVYSFGIVLWELLTRQQPYMGLRYAFRTHARTSTHKHARTPFRSHRLCALSNFMSVRLRWLWPC